MIVPPEYLLGRALARDVIDNETGELLVECNTEITEDILDILAKQGAETIETLYTNGLWSVHLGYTASGSHPH